MGVSGCMQNVRTLKYIQYFMYYVLYMFSASETESAQTSPTLSSRAIGCSECVAKTYGLVASKSIAEKVSIQYAESNFCSKLELLAPR